MSTTNRDQRYEAKRKIKRVSFNLETEKELLAKAESIPDFSGWVKDALKKEMSENKGD